jgi:hypothetical protein
MMDSGAKLVTRLPRNDLLRRELVTKALPQVRWYPVSTGESGVPREAAELGTFTLHGSRGAEDPDAEVTVRVIVTRMPRTSAPDHGIVVDSYQLELFATTLDAASWAAPDVVTLFHGRASIENRFAQEDREFDLGRTFSFHAPGQEWMVGVGMFLWNEQIVTGFREHGLPSMTAHRVPRSLIPAIDSSRPSLPKPAAGAAMVHAPSHVGIPPTPPVVGPPAAAAQTLHDVMSRTFADVRSWAGWSVEVGGIRCEQGRLLHPYSATGSSKAGGPRLAVRTEQRACDGCPVRARCFGGDGPYKQVCRTVTEHDFQVARRALAQLREPRDPPKNRRRPTRQQPPSELTPLSTAPVVFVPPVPVQTGSLVPQPPRFLPAEARRQVRLRARSVDVVLAVGRPRPTEPPRHILLNTNAADRAHRRRTQNEAREKWTIARATTIDARPRAPTTASSANDTRVTL